MIASVRLLIGNSRYYKGMLFVVCVSCCVLWGMLIGETAEQKTIVLYGKPMLGARRVDRIPVEQSLIRPSHVSGWARVEDTQTGVRGWVPYQNLPKGVAYANRQEGKMQGR